MAEIDYDKMAAAQVKANKRAGLGAAVDVDTDILNKSFKQLSNSARDAGEGIAKFGTNAYRTFQDLSKSGASFSGDLVGMTAAAYNSRLSLAEFGQVIKDNSSSLTGLGGNVTRGAEAFARLSKSFFDDKASQELRNLGYTSKDLNEVLAIQAGQQKSSFKDTEDGRRQSNIAARNLAIEMDTIAKLTGKSREAQMEEMKRKQVDGQVESKFRLIALEQGEEKAAQVRLAFEQQRAAAAKRGDEEIFKQQFATGTYMTEAAATEAALKGRQARETENQARELGRGNISGALEASSKADVAALSNANNKTILQVARFGGAIGPAGDAAQKMIEATDPMYQSVKKVADANGILLKTQEDYAKALRLTLNGITEAQAGRRQEIDEKTGKPIGAFRDVSGTARAGAAAETVSQDIKAVAASFVIAGDKGKELSDTFGAMAKAGLSLIDRAKIEEELNKAGKPARPDIGSASPAERKADAEARGGTIGTLSRVFDKVTSITADGVKSIFVGGVDVLKSRETGSLGMTGKLIEDFGSGTLTMLHGKEGVITQDQLTNLASGLREESVASAIGVLKSSLGKGSNIGLKTNVASPAAKNTTTKSPESTAIDELKSSLGKVVGAKDKAKNTAYEDENRMLDIEQMKAQFALSRGDTVKATTDAIKSNMGKTGNIDLNQIPKGIKTNIGDSNLPKVDLNNLKLPGFAEQIKANASSVPQEINKKSPQTESPKPEAAPQKTATAAPAITKDASLNDVVKSLESLNKQMGTLIAQNEDIGNKQISATRSKSSNIYERT